MIQHGIWTFEAECLLKAYLKCLHNFLSKINYDFIYFYQWPKFKTSKSNSSIPFILPIALYSSFIVFVVKDTYQQIQDLVSSLLVTVWCLNFSSESSPTGNLAPTSPLSYVIPTSLEKRLWRSGSLISWKSLKKEKNKSRQFSLASPENAFYTLIYVLCFYSAGHPYSSYVIYINKYFGWGEGGNGLIP